MEKNLYIMKLHSSEHIVPDPRPFIISRFPTVNRHVNQGYALEHLMLICHSWFRRMINLSNFRVAGHACMY